MRNRVALCTLPLIGFSLRCIAGDVVVESDETGAVDLAAMVAAGTPKASVVALAVSSAPDVLMDWYRLISHADDSPLLKMLAGWEGEDVDRKLLNIGRS
ncbi:hypothetical protein BKA93DRAFT_221706 [Sparassis latifolia]